MGARDGDNRLHGLGASCSGALASVNAIRAWWTVGCWRPGEMLRVCPTRRLCTQRAISLRQRFRESALPWQGCLEIHPRHPADYFNADRIGSRSLRVSHEPSRVGALPIEATFPHIAFHIIEAPRIGRSLADGLRRGATHGSIPCVIGRAGRVGIITITEPRGGARSGGVLPFGSVSSNQECAVEPNRLYRLVMSVPQPKAHVRVQINRPDQVRAVSGPGIGYGYGSLGDVAAG
jgi:hypothetical protein